MRQIILEKREDNMGYKDLNNETNELYEERLELVTQRLAEIEKANELYEPFAEYFRKVASYLLLQNEILIKAINGQIEDMSEDEGKAYNQKLYDQFKASDYETSYANPAYAVKMLGEEYGKLLSSVFYNIITNSRYVFEGSNEYLCIYCELVVELYNLFEDRESVSPKEISDTIYSFMHDYTEVFTQVSVNRLLDPEYDYFRTIVMEQDVCDTACLYRYGLPVDKDQCKSIEYLATFSDEEIQSMADTFTEGYRMGFIAGNKDISKKSVVEIRYPLGFERMVRTAIRNFEKIGLKSILKPSSVFNTLFENKYMESVNKQVDFDHKEDAALWYDKAFVEYRIECYRNALLKNKEIGPNYGGPAVIEIFGEEPFTPVAKQDTCKYSDEQQKLLVHMTNECAEYLNQCIKSEERSFTIISYPVASIGDKFEEIFSETVKLNTLDYVLYRDIQQKIIDALDTADRVHIVGANGNKTDLYVKIYDLENPDKETAFENCVADVNIPVGEVFTSPVLEGTNGKLHVSQVYLNDLNYKNLEIDFKDGMVAEYTCSNFEKEEENKKYIKDNLLYHYDTLPLGEFAIGTNTTAYKMTNVYDIAEKMPILIAEKTGPHFAVGDTCYKYDEDNTTFNPDGKMIVARDNSVSLNRKEDISKAYFNCHTDITIPYDELGAITIIRKDGSETDIIRDGRFVLDGTQELNKPLDELEAIKNK